MLQTRTVKILVLRGYATLHALCDFLTNIDVMNTL